MKNYSIYLFALVMAFALTSCGGGEGYIKYPVDDMLAKTSNDKLPMSIVLYDMDVKGSRRLNKYKVTTNLDDSVKRKTITTQWLRVSKADFARNYDNMGMEIASKTMGANGQPKISKVPAPPGYANYVGNQKYGQWKTRSDGTSFWAFYGQYMFMRTMFNMATYPVYRNSYMGYRRNYYGRRAYYGGTGTRRRYGTGSRFSRSTSRSGYYSSGRSSRSSSSYRSYRSSRSSRSGSRSGYSSRSRSGSSGK